MSLRIDSCSSQTYYRGIVITVLIALASASPLAADDAGDIPAIFGKLPPKYVASFDGWAPSRLYATPVLDEVIRHGGQAQLRLEELEDEASKLGTVLNRYTLHITFSLPDDLGELDFFGGDIKREYVAAYLEGHRQMGEFSVREIDKLEFWVNEEGYAFAMTAGGALAGPRTAMLEVLIGKGGAAQAEETRELLELVDFEGFEFGLRSGDPGGLAEALAVDLRNLEWTEAAQDSLRKIVAYGYSRLCGESLRHRDRFLFADEGAASGFADFLRSQAAGITRERVKTLLEPYFPGLNASETAVSRLSQGDMTIEARGKRVDLEVIVWMSDIGEIVGARK